MTAERPSDPRLQPPPGVQPAPAPGLTLPPVAPGADLPPARGAGLALTLLILINLFNYIDRQVLAAVEPQIRAEFFPRVKDPATGAETEPPVRLSWLGFTSRSWMGLLSSAFLITYMLGSPVFGWLANRTSRWLLVGLGVTLWSLASGASGLAPLYFLMLLTRCFVGIGEAAYGPVAPDMISDLYPVKHRGRVMAWFYAAIPVGGALGYALGDQTVHLTGNWRVAFYLVVPPGLLLGLWCFFMPEPVRGQADRVRTVRRHERWSDYRALLKTPSYVLNTLGMTAMTFAIGGMAFWVPDYLEYKHAGPLGGVNPKTAFGALTALCGLVATLLGGLAGDALRGRLPGSYFVVSGVAMLVGFPMILWMTQLPFPAAWVPLVVAVFCLFFNTGPTNTIIANVTHPLLRAPAFALNILAIHLLGDVISPPIMGAIADRSSPDRAFQFVSVLVLVGGVLWLWGARHLARDTALAPTRLPD
jgi:MFS transporter, Spinster family, sphingosine-1-phosphate transporter